MQCTTRVVSYPLPTSVALNTTSLIQLLFFLPLASEAGLKDVSVPFHSLRSFATFVHFGTSCLLASVEYPIGNQLKTPSPESIRVPVFTVSSILQYLKDRCCVTKESSILVFLLASLA